MNTYRRNAALVALLCASAPIGATAQIELVSKTASGVDLDGKTGYNACISDGGQFIAFESDATNAPGSNGVQQVYVKDMVTGTIELISKSASGLPGNNTSTLGDMTPDGRYVVYWSFATNLPGELGPAIDVFHYDRLTNTTTLVSVGMGGVAANAVSKNPSITTDGTRVAMLSAAGNLVPNDTNNGSGKFDVFVRDLIAGTTERVNVSSSGQQDLGAYESVDISGDGRYVLFDSGTAWSANDTDNLLDTYVKDRFTGQFIFVADQPFGPPSSFLSQSRAISRDGSAVLFTSSSPYFVPNDGNNTSDAFVYRIASGTIECASLAKNGIHTSNGGGAPNAISDDGRFVVFHSAATDISLANSNPVSPPNPVAYVRDTLTSRTMALTISPATGEVAIGGAVGVAFDASGRFIAFNSTASTFDPADTDAANDAFRARLAFGEHGGSIEGSNGKPRLVGTGDLTPSSNNSLSISNLIPNAVGVLVLSAQYEAAPFKAGFLLTGFNNLITIPVAADGSGAWSVAFTLPPFPLTPGAVTMQALFSDSGAHQGVSFTNAISAVMH